MRSRPCSKRRALSRLRRAAAFTGALGFAAESRAGDPVVVDAGPDWSLTVTGQIRPRLVIHSGLDFRGSRSEWRELVTERARLGLSAESGSGVGATIELQDARVWGEEASPDESRASGLDVHQAFGRVPVGREFEVRIGRQELVFDDERLVGNSDFDQRGRAFDGARLSWRSLDERNAFDVFYAKVEESGRTAEGHVPALRAGDVDFGGAHAALEPFPGFVLSPLYLVHVRQAPSDVRHTAGLHVAGEARGFSYRIEGYYQYGKYGTPQIHAFLGALRAGYVFGVKPKPAVYAWAEALSGDGTPEGSFDTLYGSRHVHYGQMDLFANLPAATRYRGLVDLAVRAETDVVPRLRAGADVHSLSTYDRASDGERHLGEEIDVRVAWAAADYVTVDAFYGLFIPGKAIGPTLDYPGGTLLHPDSLVYLTTNLQF